MIAKKIYNAPSAKVNNMQPVFLALDPKSTIPPQVQDKEIIFQKTPKIAKILTFNFKLKLTIQGKDLKF